MNPDVLLTILAGVLTTLSIVNILYTWWRTRDKDVEKRDKAVAERFTEGSKRMDRLDVRMASVEQSIRGQPSREDLHEVHLSVKGMEGELKAMLAVMEGSSKIMSRLEAIVARHEDHLLGGGKQ
jgi:hypothetical protein